VSVRVPHFALPLRLAVDSSLAVVEQDTLEEIAASAEAILRTPFGFRVELPEFGIAELAMRKTVPEQGAETAVRRFEPRADVVLAAAPDAIDPNLTRVRALISAGPEGAP
jgi:phage baseplate assembly protein W